MTKGRRAPSGFTLLELLIVLAIVGLLMGLVVTHGPAGSRTASTKAAATELAAALREARSRAIIANRPIRIRFNLAARTYRIENETVQALPRDLAVSLLTITGEARKDTDPGIRFDPDGSSTGGRVALAAGDQKIEIGVDWLTGRVRIVNAQ